MAHRSIGVFSNETEEEMTINLEPRCEEIILGSGDKVELLAEGEDQNFPLDILYHKQSIQIYPKYDEVSWLIRFCDQDLIPDYPTRLSDFKS